MTGPDTKIDTQAICNGNAREIRHALRVLKHYYHGKFPAFVAAYGLRADSPAATILEEAIEQETA